MSILEAAGTEQTRKTLRRHGVRDPLFGVLISAMKPLVKRIGVDHELAMALWATGNYDAQVLAAKVADPAQLSVADLDRLAREGTYTACGTLVAQLAVDSAHGRVCAEAWLVSPSEVIRATGWSVVGGLALRDESLPDSWFEQHLDTIERTIHVAPNVLRSGMNHSLITIGCRNAALRERATAAALRIGDVQIDHGDTWCETPAAAAYIAKSWAYAATKGFADPAVQERARESVRTRC